MSSLYFKHGTLRAGKSIELLKTAHNYEEQGKKVAIFTSALDTRNGKGRVSSRIGKSREAIAINEDTDLWDYAVHSNIKDVDCVLVDEAQFLKRHHVIALSMIVDIYKIPVIAFGLKNDFKNRLFEGSEALLTYADKIEELKSMCAYCNKKAIMNGRFVDGVIEIEGTQIVIGDEQYTSLCRKCYMDEVKKQDAKKENE